MRFGYDDDGSMVEHRLVLDGVIFSGNLSLYRRLVQMDRDLETASLLWRLRDYDAIYFQAPDHRHLMTEKDLSSPEKRRYAILGPTNADEIFDSCRAAIQCIRKQLNDGYGALRNLRDSLSERLAPFIKEDLLAIEQRWAGYDALFGELEDAAAHKRRVPGAKQNTKRIGGLHLKSLRHPKKRQTQA